MDEIRIVVPLETVHAIRKWRMWKNVKKGIERSLTPWHVVGAMPNQPAPDKVILALRISRTLKRRLEKLAKQRKETITEVVIAILNQQVQHVELTPDDYRKIAAEVEEARKGSVSDKRLRPRRVEGGADA